jgi:hypothetical protein
MAKILGVQFSNQVILRGGVERIDKLTAQDAQISLEPGGLLVRVRVPAQKLHFCTPASNCTLEYEWVEEPRPEPDASTGTRPSAKFNPGASRG